MVLWLETLPQMAVVAREGSDQTALMCSLIRVFACHYCHIVGHHMTWLIYIFWAQVGIILFTDWQTRLTMKCYRFPDQLQLSK